MGKGSKDIKTLDRFEPSYIKTHREGRLKDKIETLLSMLRSCVICPRRCKVNRLEGEEGYCKSGRMARVASFNSHFGEESPLVGRYGSGTIFLSSCNLLCSFCQNYEISHLREGMEVSPDQLADMMLQLQSMGCHNINFVTPTHMIAQIMEALPLAIDRGLHIPLVYNSSGYDSVHTLKILEGVFDIYMPDFKFWDSSWAKRYCNAPDYRERAIEAIKEMHRQVGDLKLTEDGIALRGLIIRHLVMPEGVAGSEGVLNFISKEISQDTYVNIMDQYRPCGKALEDEYINRRISAKEFREAMAIAKRVGLRRLDPRDRIRFIFVPY